ncbi:MAG: 8-oxo-dGTP diphosphatase MutT [Gammaproteobacteria bacterium]|nr:8-oxo-dGTP diphosphatase MutT [Gammaproteobacteria bacterium]
MDPVHVAVGVLRNDQGQVLISLRADEAHQGGLWEFPGGKVEPGESVEQALSREFEEELGICVHSCTPFIQISHDYEDKSVLLDVWNVQIFSGVPRGREGQQIEWRAQSALCVDDFPRANARIIRALQLT